LTSADFLPLLPLLIVAYASVLVLVIGAFWRSHAAMGILTLLSLAAGFVADRKSVV